MGVTTNPIYASEAFLPISFRSEDFRTAYVPFVDFTDVDSWRALEISACRSEAVCR
jgi:hypothetical protein